MNEEKERSRYVFEDMPVRKALMEMALPMIVSQLIVLVYNMADVFFLGSTNNPYMVAGASLVLPLFNISICIANIAGTGGGTLISRLLGVGREDEARKVSAFSAWFSVFASAVLSLLVFLFLEPVLTLAGASAETMPYARQYVTCVVIIGAVPTILSMTLGNLVRSAGQSKKAGFGVSMGGILNILLDPLFMFVILPEGNEALGAGIATLLSNCVSCVYFIVTILRMKDSVIKLSVRQGLPEKKTVRSLFSVGIPAGIGPLLFDVDYVVLDKLMSSYSDIALAAVGIVLKAERLPLNTGVGLCMGMVPIAAYNYSSGNRERMKQSVKAARRIGAVIAIISILLYEVFAPYILRFFIRDSATVELGTRFLRSRAIATVVMFLSFSYVNFFSAVGRGDTALLLVVIRWVVFNIPMLFIMNALFGMNGLVFAQFISDTAVAVISEVIYRRFIRKEELKSE